MLTLNWKDPSTTKGVFAFCFEKKSKSKSKRERGREKRRICINVESNIGILEERFRDRALIYDK